MQGQHIHGSGAVEHSSVGMLGLEENNKRPLEDVAGLKAAQRRSKRRKRESESPKKTSHGFHKGAAVLAAVNVDALRRKNTLGVDPLYLYPGFITDIKAPTSSQPESYDVTFLDHTKEKPQIARSLSAEFIRREWFQTKELIEVDWNHDTDETEHDWRGASINDVDYCNVITKQQHAAEDLSIDVLYLLATGETDRQEANGIEICKGSARKIVFAVRGEYTL